MIYLLAYWIIFIYSFIYEIIDDFVVQEGVDWTQKFPEENPCSLQLIDNLNEMAIKKVMDLFHYLQSSPPEIFYTGGKLEICVHPSKNMAPSHLFEWDVEKYRELSLYIQARRLGKIPRTLPFRP